MLNGTDYPTGKELCDALNGKWVPAQRRGRAKCPAHADHSPSLDIEEKGGRTLVICRAGCTQDAVLESLRAKGHWPARRANGNGKAGGTKTIVATYSYQLESGDEHFQVVRFAPKDFRPRHRGDNGDWIWKRPPTGWCLPYRLPELLDGIAHCHPVFVLEGEKDVDNARAKLGVVATCNAGGARKWQTEHAAYLKGCDVIVIPHNDDAGRQHAESVAVSLAGIAKRVRILILPELPPKGDVSDWLAAGGGTAEQLWEFVEQAPEWQQGNATHGRTDAWPDPVPLPHSLLPVAPFDYEMLPEKVRPWVKDVCERMQCPPDFVGVSVMAALGSVIGRKVTVRPQRNDDWSVTANQWALCVGRPAS